MNEKKFNVGQEVWGTYFTNEENDGIHIKLHIGHGFVQLPEYPDKESTQVLFDNGQTVNVKTILLVETENVVFTVNNSECDRPVIITRDFNKAKAKFDKEVDMAKRFAKEAGNVIHIDDDVLYEDENYEGEIFEIFIAVQELN